MNIHRRELAGMLLQEAIVFQNRYSAKELTDFLIDLVKLADAMDAWRVHDTKFNYDRLVQAHNELLKYGLAAIKKKVLLEA